MISWNSTTPYSTNCPKTYIEFDEIFVLPYTFKAPKNSARKPLAYSA